MNRLSYQTREKMTGLAFISPALISFLVFLAYPMVYGFLLSFTDNRNAGAALHFTGLANYVRLLTKDSYFQISLGNNLFYAVTFAPGVLVAAMLVALLLNGRFRGRGALRTICFFPYLTSMVAVATIWNLILAPNGPMNQILRLVGIANPPGWLMDKDWAMFSIVLVSVWKNFGYYMILLLAGLQSIPEYLYESARIDGATPGKSFWYITLPMLSSTIFLCTITVIISAFQEFDLVKVMTEGGPGRATNVLVLRIYQEGFVNMKMGYASAIAYILFAIIMVITLLQFAAQKKWVHYD